VGLIAKRSDRGDGCVLKSSSFPRYASLALFVAISCSQEEKRPGEDSSGTGTKEQVTQNKQTVDRRESAGTVVRKCDFGPLLGGTIVQKIPGPGNFTGSYRYTMTRYPTREQYLSHSVEGVSRLTLLADGSATGCFAVKKREYFSESKYTSYDGNAYTDETERRFLLGAKGSWSVSGGDARVVFSKTWRDSCELTEGGSVSLDSKELGCVIIEENDRLPLPTLACRLEKSDYYLDEISLNLSDSPTAGPYTLQTAPTSRVAGDKGQGWLLMGTMPGLHVTANLGRGKGGDPPGVTFTAGAVSLVEKKFIRTPAKAP
jgi:hypothetical protein